MLRFSDGPAFAALLTKKAVQLTTSLGMADIVAGVNVAPPPASAGRAAA